MGRPPPDRTQLLDDARAFARSFHGIDAPEAELGERIDYVVWGRKQGWAAVEAGDMSERELVGLLIDHFDYECADRSGRSWSAAADAEREAFVERLGASLFGAGR